MRDRLKRAADQHLGFHIYCSILLTIECYELAMKLLGF